MKKINQLVEIANNQIEVQQKGEGGIPIVILPGMGCSFDDWHHVTEQVSKTNKVIIYHRPGLGKSSIGNEVRNTETVVEELKELINQLEISGKIMLAGHSYGGLCVQHFVKRYPEQVAGVLLIDSTSVDFAVLDELELPVLNENSTDEIWMEKCLSYSKMTRMELESVIQPGLSEQQQLPIDLQQSIKEFQSNPLMYKAMYSEVKHWKEDAIHIKKLGDFPTLPLTVIGRDKEYNIQLGIEEGFPKSEMTVLECKWEELITEQAALSKNSQLIFARQASHSVYLDRPDIIIEALHKLNTCINKQECR